MAPSLPARPRWPGYQDSTAPFWAERDYLVDADKIGAATFIIHGLNDTNVKTTNAGHLWEVLPEATPKKIWWLRGGHDDPANPGLTFPLADRFVEYTHRWFARFLKGIDTGVLDEAPVQVQQEDGTWADALGWPPRGPNRAFYPTSSGLAETPADGTLTYTDGVGPPAAGSSTVSGTSLTLDSAPLAGGLRVAGQAVMRLRYALSNGGDTTFAYRLLHLRPNGSTTEIASGYARGAYREEIAARGASYPTTPRLHEPGRSYDIAFPFVHNDYVVPDGHRIRLIVRADDERVTAGGNASTVTLHLGGASALIIEDAPSREAEHRRAHCAFHPADEACA